MYACPTQVRSVAQHEGQHILLVDDAGVELGELLQVPNKLPATQTLEKENIFVMTETRAITQDIRPLKILLLNLMPTKIDTETQLSRLLGNTPLQVELTLMHTSSHESKNTSQEHLLAFYTTFDRVKEQYFDGMIDAVTFEEV